MGAFGPLEFLVGAIVAAGLVHLAWRTWRSGAARENEERTGRRHRAEARTRRRDPEYSVVRHTSAAQFFETAGALLESKELENSLLLGIVLGARERGGALPEDVYLVSVHASGQGVVGAALRTGPRALLLTAMGPGACTALAAHAEGACEALREAHGPDESITAFAAVWCAQTGATQRVHMRQRLHAATTVAPDLPSPEGGMRPATPGDEAQLIEWQRAFASEVGEDEHAVDDSAVARMTRLGQLFVWADAGALMAAAASPSRTEHSARITMVYTPPARRGRGHGTALTAALTTRLLEAGLTPCLFTDLANPTSNRIYARIGYQPVRDYALLHFATDEEPPASSRENRSR